YGDPVPNSHSLGVVQVTTCGDTAGRAITPTSAVLAAAGPPTRCLAVRETIPIAITGHWTWRPGECANESSGLRRRRVCRSITENSRLSLKALTTRLPPLSWGVQLAARNRIGPAVSHPSGKIWSY